VVCHSGVGLIPVVDNTVHHFSAGGLYNGLVLLIDDETRSYWDHITGEALHGPLAGKAQLEMFSIEQTNVAAALQADPGLTVSRSIAGFGRRAFGWLSAKTTARKKGFLPPGFRQTMAETDPRLPEMTSGLGLIASGSRRFYPRAALDGGPVADSIDGRPIHVAIDPTSKIPFAQYLDDNTRPMQLFTRWYGFSLTYPGCEVYGEGTSAPRDE
jgi:hypothetical protein